MQKINNRINFRLEKCYPPRLPLYRGIQLTDLKVVVIQTNKL